jgi:rsbT co-antagonist protein RsbR
MVEQRWSSIAVAFSRSDHNWEIAMIQTSSQLPADLATQSKRLRQFLRWLTPIIFGFALLYASTAILFRDWPTAVNGGVIFGYSCLLLVAWGQLRRGRMQQTIWITCGGLLVAVLIMAILQPALYPNLAVVPVLVVAVALPYTQGRQLRRLIVVCWLVTVIIALVGEFVPSQSHLPIWLFTVLRVSSLVATIAFVFFLLWQFSSRLTETLLRTQEINAALQNALAEVEARAATQEQLLEENEAQRATIRELSAPVLPLSRTTILLPLVGALDSERLLLAQEQVLNTLYHSSIRLLVLDITGVLVVDTQVARGLIALSQAARLLGAEVALVGIRAEVAQTIVDLGLDLQGLHTYRDLEMLLTTRDAA